MVRLVKENRSRRGMRYLVDSMAFEIINRSSARIVRARGYRVAVFANDLIGNWISVFGVWEHEELSQVFEFLKPIFPRFSNSLALDVGANIGNHSMYFAKYFKNVMAFEPNKKTYDVLRVNCSTFHNIQAMNYGLGEKAGSAIMAEDIINAGGAGISKEVGQGVEIKIDTLDSLEKNCSEISLIKMDVEGYEEQVIKGGLQLIKRHQPIILLEQHEADFSNDRSPALEILRENSYVFCWLKSGSERKTRVLATLENAVEVLFGRSHRFFCSDRVPVGNYPMIIALPRKYGCILLDGATV
jgi:FkbM family methyltransferase